MDRKIVIKSCEGCPHVDHKGAFGRPAYLPVCRKVNRELPYKEVIVRHNTHARGTGVVPDWCPLPTDNIKVN